MKAPGDPERPDFQRDPRQTVGKLPNHLRWDAFIGVENQNPGMPWAGIFQRPIALRSETVEFALENTRPTFPALFRRSICAEGVHHQNVVTPSEAVKACRQVNFLIKREYNYCNPRLQTHRSPKCFREAFGQRRSCFSRDTEHAQNSGN